jgi:hypothetical protein
LGLGEEIKESVIVQKVLRSLPMRFDSKISALEERAYLNSISMDELHGIFTAYEMRTKQENTDIKEVAFKASKSSKKKGKQKEIECTLALQDKHKKCGWYVDSGYSKHMIGDRDKFLTLIKERDGSVSFGNDDSTKIIGKGTVRIGNKNTKENNVLLVEDMEHNLLSVSQMCDQGHKVTFDSQKCEIRKEGSGKLIATTTRTSSNIYVLSKIGNEKCCLGKEDESWLWNRRMGHIHFDNLVKFSKRETVREMPLITKPTNTLCKHCQQGKQTKTRFKSKEHSMTRPLEIVHTDLVGPNTTKLI